MKRICMIFAVLFALCFTAFGSSAAQAAAPAQQAQSTAVPSTIPVDLVKIDGDTISVKDDGTGEDSGDDSMTKRVILTNRNIGYTGETGPFKFELYSLQVSEITATGAAASMLGLKDGESGTLVGIKLRVENTSSADMSWHPNMSTIVTSDKEQVESDIFMSDSVGGKFFGNVVKDGMIAFICKNTNADSLSHIQWRIDGPSDSNYNRVGEDIKIEIDFSKD